MEGDFCEDLLKRGDLHRYPEQGGGENKRAAMFGVQLGKSQGDQATHAMAKKNWTIERKTFLQAQNILVVMGEFPGMSSGTRG